MTEPAQSAVRALRRPFADLFHRLFPQYRDMANRLSAIETSLLQLAQHPTYVEDSAKILNGQSTRQAFVADLLADCEIEFVIETGTFLGDSTGWFASRVRHVHSSEVSPALYFAAVQRLSRLTNVTLHFGDSRDMLRRLHREDMSTRACLFYLDAHWYDDLPLRHELEIIDTGWKRYVIVVDDFEVPGDRGYGYDDYGGSKKLNLQYIRSVVSARDMTTFFPAAASTEETGAKRGCVILAKGDEYITILSGMSALRRQ